MPKLWQKSNTETETSTSKKAEAFTVGNDYILDQELVPYDIQGSTAHAKALNKIGILTDKELEKLTSALHEILEDWKNNEFEIRIEDEDMHTAIELSLVKKLGDLGKKIHTARSRNDQVLTAVRLYEKKQLKEIKSLTRKVAGSILDFAEAHQGIPMPGFTHTRKAMLSSVGLWAGAFAEILILQAESSGGIEALVDKSPLGSAAGFGTSFDIDREQEAEDLGFSEPLICSTTAQLSRGWTELQFVQYLSGVTSVLNRFASDVIQFSSSAYPYFDLDTSVCTGSSIMPQKKNPDVAELLRGGHSELVGFASSLQILTTNLGSGYHRDLQLSKEPVLKAVNKTKQLLEAAGLLITNMEPIKENLAEACSSEIFAAEAAYDLVKEKGMTFREAYRHIGDHPEEVENISAEEILKKYTHLGSPGNAGLEKLRERLERL
ncbi:argininosuccinate lyase [Rhodohalobacter sulfatireducens]|uniref:Argininosuccinate lyase n=1 Tax=Rhodohalobacter sulfatireducens TaxID=2911366 RepID=A0ABS9KHE5_9BACT|nr:argininosuccinate lyase [Rhodohalobacter sulfatireducens]MCG2590277.1 argininosuccinate lyase [Rhodohalobacter sulfatireducens]